HRGTAGDRNPPISADAHGDRRREKFDDRLSGADGSARVAQASGRKRSADAFVTIAGMRRCVLLVVVVAGFIVLATAHLSKGERLPVPTSDISVVVYGGAR